MTDHAKEVVRRVFQAVSDGDFDGLAAALADDVVEHEEIPGLEPNKEGVIAFFRGLKDAFPDLEMSPHALIADGDLVAARVSMRGTHRGEFMGIPATGNPVDLAVADFFRVRDGLVVEHWGVSDMASLMEQLGASADG